MESIQRSDLPTFGTPIAGGYYAGVIRINGEQFGIVVSPKDAGEIEGKWGSPGIKIPATSVCDGAANTQAMATAGSGLAQEVQALDINDQQDWYIPSRDELEVMYRNLKPTTRENICSFRDGENSSSDPIGLAYTEETPIQTTSHDFRKGGEHAMEAAWYWSSTQSSAHSAFVQDFDDGAQTNGHKDLRHRVRAVRRFKVID